VRPQSAKAKGRRLQQEVRDAVLATFPSLEPDDVRSTSMGASGADLLLSPAARRVFPYFVECKNVESLNIHKALSQAVRGYLAHFDKTGQQVFPMVVFRKNATPACGAVPFDHYLDLLKRANGAP
jgi:hypothetical protein